MRTQILELRVQVLFAFSKSLNPINTKLKHSWIRNSSSSSMATTGERMTVPPIAKKEKHEIEMFGDVRIDDYYWLRDDSRSNSDILSHLRAENSYTDFVMSGTKQFEEKLYAEIRGRIKEDGMSVPLRKGNYYYYQRTLEGEEYVRHCRRLALDVGAPLSVYHAMPTGPEAPPEHVILDENAKAKHHTYYCVHAFKVSPNNKLVAYAEDTKGDEIYTIHIIDAQTLQPLEKPLVGVTCNVEWAGNGALLYTTLDKILRPDKFKIGYDYLLPKQ